LACLARGDVEMMRLVVAATLVAALGSCSLPTTNFSQRAGFAEYFAANPRGSEPPNPADQALIARHAPRLMLPPDHPGLIGFYEDYVASGRLHDGAGRLIATNPDRATLNRNKTDPRTEFIHVPIAGAASPVVIARIDREPGPEADGATWTFLTYYAVFRHSGLPAGVSFWEEIGLRLIADLDDWHQLDHYTAVTLALDATQRPVAIALQQHNGRHTYLVGPDIAWPADGRVAIDVAIRSNELYPHAPWRVHHRAVAMPTPQAMRFLVTGRARPFPSGDDVTHGVVEQEYRLAYLPADDAFYSFAGFLGERRRLQGRSGPPGADFNATPDTKGKLREMLTGYWREDDAETLAAIDEAEKSERFAARFAELRRAAFVRDIDCVRRSGRRC
jgi:hypothetical protein